MIVIGFGNLVIDFCESSFYAVFRRDHDWSGFGRAQGKSKWTRECGLRTEVITCKFHQLWKHFMFSNRWAILKDIVLL